MRFDKIQDGGRRLALSERFFYSRSIKYSRVIGVNIWG